MSISSPVIVPDAVETFIKDEVPIADVTLAALIANSEPLCHARELDQFYRWDGTMWVEVHDNDVAAHIINPAIQQWSTEIEVQGMSLHGACSTSSGHTGACKRATDCLKSIRRYLNSGKVSDLIRALKRDKTVSKSVDDFDREPYRINCQNGVVDLFTGDFWVHDPSFLMTKKVKANFHPGATHPDWDKALNALSLMEEDTRKWVQMYLGTGLTGLRLKNNLTVFMVGNGANGKSTILDTCAHVLDGYAGFVSKASITGRDQEAAIARLDFKGLRLAMLDETKAGARLDTDATKTISGVTISARKLNVGNVSFKATHTFLIATNHEPYVSEADEGIWRRLVKVPFKRTFKNTDPDFDPGLFDRLAEGADGRAEAVLAWLIEGATQFFSAGENLLPIPEELRVATEDWANEADIIGEFVDSQCSITGVDTDRITNAMLFGTFSDWASLNGHSISYKQAGFVRAFKGHRKIGSGAGIETYRTSKDRGFTGIKFNL